MTWIPVPIEDSGDGDAVFAMYPESTSAFADLMATTEALVDTELLGVCRLRIAQSVGCDAIVRGADPALLADLASWDSSERFGPLERAALEYLEQFMVAPIDVTAEQRTNLAAQMGGDPTTFVNALYVQEAYIRFLAFLGIEDEPATNPTPFGGRDDHDGPSELEQMVQEHEWELDPRVTQALLAFGAAICRHQEVEETTDEVVRLRSANYQGCVFCQSVRRKVEWPDGTDDLMQEAMLGPASSRLSDQQKVATEILDHFLIAPGSLSRADKRRILDHFTARQVVELLLKELFWMSNKAMISLDTDIGAVDEENLTEFVYNDTGDFELRGPRVTA